MSRGVLAEVHDLVVGHAEDDEGVGEDALALHGQPLRPGPRVARQDEALLLLLDALDFAPDHPRDDVVLDDGEVLEVGLDFLAQFLLFGHFFLEQVAHRDRRKLVVVRHLQRELAYFEPRRSDDEDLLRWVRWGLLCGAERRSMRKEMGSSGCRTISCFKSSSNRS